MVNVVKSIGVKASAPKSKAATYAEQWKAERAAAAAVKVKAAPQKLKATVTDNVTPEPTVDAINEDIGALFAKYKVAVPSGTRVVISFIAAFLVGSGIGYIGSVLLEVLVMSALTFTGSVFLSVALYVLGVCATLYASYKLGSWVGGNVLSGGFGRSYANASSSVRGWFTSNNKEVTA